MDHDGHTHAHRQSSPQNTKLCSYGLLFTSPVGYDRSAFRLRIMDVMTYTSFWDNTLYSPLKVSRTFRGTYCLRLQGRRINLTLRSTFMQDTSKVCIPPAFTMVSCLAYSSIVKMEAIFPPKRRLAFNGLHDIMSQKIVRFITTAERTSNPTRRK
jgi:hypothetical protein